MKQSPPQPLPQLQLMLLDLISPARPVTQAQADALGLADWQTLLEMVHQHRLGPMLHWQLGHAHAHLVVPPEVKAVLALSHKKATLRNLQLQRELLQLHQILKKANIPYVALKGAYLAYHAYPSPALRPMRDLDVLVPKDRVLETFQLLLDSGLTRSDKHQGTPEAMMGVSQHLPPLRSASGQVTVELHSRLFHHESNGIPQADLSDAQGFWERCIQMPLAGQLITFESSTDLLLHMIEHAVYHHKFDNGPLLVSDLVFLIKTQKIDWPLFWELARKGQQTRGCLLALELAQRYWGAENISWPDHVQPTPALMNESIDAASLLMLRDFSIRRDVGLQDEIRRAANLSAKLGVLFSKVFPPKTMIASSYPVAKDDWRIYFWYPVKWHHQLTRRLFDFLKFSQKRHSHPEVRQLDKLDQWLAG